MKPAIRAIAFTTLFLAVVPRTGSAQKRGPSTPEERARAVKIAHALEDDPLAKDAKEQRDWVVQWIIDIPDVTVNVCADYFGELPKPPRGHSQEIFTQMIISSAAFMIEHPDKAKDEKAVALSGLLGSLKAYQAVLKQEAGSRWADVDKLVQMRDKGKLDEFVAETLEKCNRKDEGEPSPGTIRAFH